jgi:SAM-dependent methyltransferase
MTDDTRRHFETQGDDYARYRPTYPPALATFLAALAPDRERAVDVGCGNGQLSVLLAEHFISVEACDVSEDQVANARPHPKVRYRVAPAEALPVDAAFASVITAAQAAHWFDLPAFYREVRRIAKPGAALALLSYGNCAVEGPLAERFDSFYAVDLADFWPPERLIVERGYVDLHFPFEELEAPPMAIERDWSLPELIGYIETWSATKRARAAGEAARVEVFVAEARALWGDREVRHRATWPVRMRLGRPFNRPLAAN